MKREITRAKECLGSPRCCKSGVDELMSGGSSDNLSTTLIADMLRRSHLEEDHR